MVYASLKNIKSHFSWSQFRKLRPILNFALRGKLDPQERSFDP
jgi:hypothetical protein